MPTRVVQYCFEKETADPSALMGATDAEIVTDCVRAGIRFLYVPPNAGDQILPIGGDPEVCNRVGKLENIPSAKHSLRGEMHGEFIYRFQILIAGFPYCYIAKVGGG
ncbi:hypothetical protein SAMN05216275_10653 [Streptosporangium canum]|uniref:Uncharacterized protein n=1 Tax=Streptosporangium canum TaxID=324952 RepID=A0A1I3MYQ1_9ACTN|nr:hypothetical protein [Streptosporangium canum]SFJ02087.1 hypothetical protein SAMN05216275_10653 [Streptosporangium canum]